MDNKRQFEAIINEHSLDDGGVASFTFEVQSLKKGDIYKEHMKLEKAWDGHGGMKEVPSGYVIDDNACWWKIGSASFKERFKEIQNVEQSQI